MTVSNIALGIVVQWLPTLLTLLIWIVLFCSRQWLITKITSSVEHKFNREIEVVRSEYKKAEAQFVSDLKSKEQSISALRDSVLLIRSQRQSLVDKRKIEAVDKLWASVVEYSKLKSLAASMAIVNFDYAASNVNSDPKVKLFFAEIAKLSPGIIEASGLSERPFVSKVTWAYYQAFVSVLNSALARAKALELGIPNAHKMIDTKREKDVLKAALPKFSKIIDEQDAGAHFYLLEYIEELMIAELKAFLEGRDEDQMSSLMAEEIIKKSDELKRGLN